MSEGIVYHAMIKIIVLVDRNQFFCFSAAQRFEASFAVARLARVEFMAARDIGLKNKLQVRFSSAFRRVEKIVQANKEPHLVI